MRRQILGVVLIGSALGLFCGARVHAASSTLEVCVIAVPGEACGSTGGGSGSGGSSGAGGGGSSGGGAGGGGGGGAPVAFDPNSGEVYFSGVAYPGSTVTLMRDGNMLASTIAGPDARFQFNISNVTPGTHTYGVWSLDSRGVRSVTNSFSIAVSPGVGTVVSGIYLPPTIDVDKREVKRGEPITILGASAPQVTVNVIVHSTDEILKTITSDRNGLWKYTLDTLELGYGEHEATARWRNSAGISPLSAPALFSVSDITVKKETPKKGANKGDINGDTRVDIRDFSIMAYWYKRTFTAEAQKIDVNKDGKIDLKDFSILAYNWTG